ncbi:MAG: beta-propeller domain-containing protein, partial [Clostridia bacterium]|nr:beta-propeller domain-containing protein [Clostridia bacterium]
MKKSLSTIAVLMAICLVTACSLEGIPNVQPNLPELPEIPDKPQIPEKEIEYFADEAELLSFIEEHFVYSVEYDYDDVIVEDAVPIMPMPEASRPSVAPMAPTDPVPTPAPSAPAPMEPSAGDTSKNENVSFPTDDSAESDDVSSTNVQVEGIDEGDILKTDGKYIYIIQNHVFTIIDITKDVPEKVASVNLNTDNNSLYINEMYIKGDKAILLCNESVREENRYTSADTGVDD